MIELSKVLICNIDNKIYALKFYDKRKRNRFRTDYPTIGNETYVYYDYVYLYKDIIDEDCGRIYQFGKRLESINPITYYMTEDEVVEYLNKNNTLKDFNSYRVIARAIKYEQEKLYKDDQENIKKLVK